MNYGPENILECVNNEDSGQVGDAGIFMNFNCIEI